MTPSQLEAAGNTSAGVLGLLAAAIGVPTGYLLTRGLLASLSKTYGFGSVHVTLSLNAMGLLTPVMIVVSMAGSAIPVRRAARLPIVEVLRNE
jgi:putative ABC transport system permease protein